MEDPTLTPMVSSILPFIAIQTEVTCSAAWHGKGLVEFGMRILERGTHVSNDGKEDELWKGKRTRFAVMRLRTPMNLSPQKNISTVLANPHKATHGFGILHLLAVSSILATKTSAQNAVTTVTAANQNPADQVSISATSSSSSSSPSCRAACSASKSLWWDFNCDGKGSARCVGVGSWRKYLKVEIDKVYGQEDDTSPSTELQ